MTMTSRERVLKVLNHRKPDRIPVDLGGMHCSGAHVSIISKLRRALKLDPPGTPVKVRDHYQMSGDIELALIDALKRKKSVLFGSPPVISRSEVRSLSLAPPCNPRSRQLAIELAAEKTGSFVIWS